LNHTTITRLDEENEDDLIAEFTKSDNLGAIKSNEEPGMQQQQQDTALNKIATAVVKPLNKNTRRISVSELTSKQHSTPLITSMMSSSSSFSNKLNLTPSTTAKKQSQKTSAASSSKLNKNNAGVCSDTNENGMKQTKLDTFMRKKPLSKELTSPLPEQTTAGAITNSKEIININIRKKKLFVNTDESDEEEEETITTTTRLTPEQQCETTSNKQVVLQQSDNEMAQKSNVEQQEENMDVKSSSRSSSPVSYTAPLSPKKVNSIPDYDEDDEDFKENKEENSAMENEEKNDTVKEEDDNVAEFVEPKLLPPTMTKMSNQQQNQDEAANNTSDVNMSISSTKAELSSYMDEVNETTMNNVVPGVVENNLDEKGTIEKQTFYS
jgi:hypothetical protein